MQVKKLTDVIKELNLVNIITKSVIPNPIQDDILRQERSGDDAYNDFVQNRIVGETNHWDKVTKVKL